jgi:hypothetical protein
MVRDAGVSKARWLVAAGVMSALAVGCGRSAAVQTTSSLPLHRVVVYRNGVGYFERQGHVAESEVNFHVLQREVGDFLATLAVMERGGSSVRAAAFPLPEERANGEAPRPELRRTVRLALDGREHDLAVGYTVETPIWRPSYRLVFANNNAEVQAWGIVQNLSGEDWTNVSLSLVAGSPVSFRSELATPVIPTRPVVTDEGSVIDAVPTSETTLAQGGEGQAPAPTTGAAPEPEPDDNTNGVVDEIQQQVDVSGLRARNSRGPVGRAAGASAQREQRAFSDLPPAPPRTTTPRNVAALAAVAVQGGATRYDLPQRVTIPDRSATMVMLAAREVPGRQMFLYAPDPGIAASASHPFRVARFENRTGAMLERGPIAIFEAGAYLGQGMVDALPDGATATIPFSLERSLAVEQEATSAVEGARLVAMQRGILTIERFSVTRTTYRARNGDATAARVMIRHPLNNGRLHEPPPGTEEANGSALVPVDAPARARGEVIVTTRSPFTLRVELGDEQAAVAIEQYLRDGSPAAPVAQSLRAALDLRHQIEERERERGDLVQRRDDLQQGAEETRENLRAIQRNPQAADLRARLTARLGRVATELDQLTRRIVELDTQVSERRVRLTEAVREIDIDTSRQSPAQGREGTTPGR